MTDDKSSIPDENDNALTFAYGEKTTPPPSPSVLEHIGKLAGSKPKVLLRDTQPGEAQILKPLEQDNRTEAGKYVVHGELGRGGVGTVHRGHDQDLGRDVAMKFLHEKYRDEPSILHRFVEEAQIGGQLQHPGIVPVYDLGLVDGKPFFSMKLVKGQTLAKKLAERTSPTDDSRTFFAIFEDVCQTLAYAHARGVVHRDLKPANIMIGSFGEVQVVDWGMGKVLPTGDGADEKLAAQRQAEVSVIETVRSAGQGSQSRIGSVMGTPAYMPPEQARGDIEHMDERSDVFALGAILCEILTGKPPYVGQSDKLIGIAATAKLDDAYARLEACGGEPEMVELALSCLMPAPAARPESAEVVAKAVHDHLAAVESRVHEARVEAAESKVRATALKRTQKLGLGLIAVFAAGLLISLWFWRAADKAAKSEKLARDAAVAAAENEKLARAEAVASAQEARRNEQLAVEQTELAKRELARAVEIKTLITEMLGSVTPEQAKVADITLLKGILATASQRLVDGAIEDELVAAELHNLTGHVYKSIGLYPEAELHLPVALEIRKRLLGDDHPDTLTSMGYLASLYAGQGRYAEAEPLSIQSLKICKRVLGAEHPHTLGSMHNLASLYAGQGRYAEAETLYLQALDIKQRVQGEEHPNTLGSMGNLANLYVYQSRYAEAEPLYVQTLKIRERVLGEEHPDTLASMHNLASLYADQGLYAEAETLYLQVLEIKKRVLGQEHPDTLTSMNNLANLYDGQGRYTLAESLSLQTLEIRKRVLGEEHPDTLGSMHNLASLYAGQGRNAEAESLNLQTLEIRKRVLGEEHPDTLTSMYNLASLYFNQGRYAEAEPLYLQAHKIQMRVLGQEHPSTLDTTTNLGLLYNSMERFDEAAAMFEVSLPIMGRMLGPQHPFVDYAMRGLVTAYLGMGRAEAALPLQRELLELQVARADAIGASTETLNEAAWSLLTIENASLRDPERALALVERACALDDDDWILLDTLALAQFKTGQTDAAIVTQKRALALMPAGADPRAAERLAGYEAAARERK